MAAFSHRPVGRPKLPGSLKTIRLREFVFNLWRGRKHSLGFGERTDSEFAEFLLHRRATNYGGSDEDAYDFSLPVGDGTGALPLFSTPIRGHHASSFNTDVDITGVTQGETEHVSGSVMFAASLANTGYCTVQGNPYSVFNADQSADAVHGDDSTDGASHLLEDSDDDLELTFSMASVVEKLVDDQSESDDSSDDDSSNVFEYENEGVLHSVLEVEDMDISESCLDEERTVTMIEDIVETDEAVVNHPQHPHSPENCAQEPNNLPPLMQSKKVEDNTEVIIKKMKAALDKLTTLDGFEEFVSLQSRSRYLVSQEKLVELVGSTCCEQKDGQKCNAQLSFHSKVVGSSLELTWYCKSGHGRKWVSSETLPSKKRGTIATNDGLLASAVIISGNNYSKFSLLCQALGMQIISEASFLRFQKHCAAPVIEEVWLEMNELVKQIFKDYEEICLCGDGRNDSPGHSARYCVYTLVEHFTSAVVDFSVIDKRETGGNSTTMEKEALRRLLEKLAVAFPFQELTTDASPAVIKLVRELKEKYPQLMELFHSLDIWHKAKKLTKALHQAAKIKGCSDLKDWVDPIVNHFWFCCQTAKGSEERIKDTWQGVLHHVCGEHEWAEGKCMHEAQDGETADANTRPKYLTKDSKTLAALRKIVLDPKWLKTLHFYVWFRHTSVLESYNSMMTKYVPKRMAFEYAYFIMRVTLAAIDHNYHLSRKPAQRKDGGERGHRKYSKRSQKYHAEVVREEKSYNYFPFLICKMLQRRSQMEGSFSQPSDRNEFDPKQIAPTLAMKEPPPTEVLMKGPSRFLKKS